MTTPDATAAPHDNPARFPGLEENIWGEPKREREMSPWLVIKPPTMLLKANQDNQIPLASGVECVGFKIQNNSGATITREIDAPAGPGSWNVGAGGNEYLDVFCTTLHVWVSVDTILNNTAVANSVIIEAGLQP